jgi:ribokinase
VSFVGCVGDDERGLLARQQLAEADVDVHGLRVSSAETGMAIIIVGEDAETQIAVSPGANWCLDPEDIAGRNLGECQAVICQFEIPDRAVGAAAKHTRGLLCLNPAPARPIPEDVLSRVNVVVANVHEYEFVRGRDTGALVALTLGKEGAVLLRDGEELARARPPAVEAVDGTGAGDAFVATLIVSMLVGLSDEECLTRACAAGAAAASRVGGATAMPDFRTVSELVGLDIQME